MNVIFILFHAVALYVFYAALFVMRLCPIRCRHKKADAYFSSNQSFFRKLERALSGNKKKIVHLHCASVGEFLQLKDIANRLIEKNFGCVLTFTSSALDTWLKNRNFPGFLYCNYAPIDFGRNADKLCRLLNPACLIVAKDLPPNMLRHAKLHGVPIFLVSASISSAVRNRFLRSVRRFVYSHFTTIFAVSEEQQKRFRSITDPSVECKATGDPRFDTTYENRWDKPEKIPTGTKTEFTLIVGSSHASDVECILPALNRHLLRDPTLKLIIAPHEPTQKECDAIQSFLNPTLSVGRWSTWTEDARVTVLIVDGIGVLSKLYQYADMAYIGGGFDGGVHNTMEPTVHDIPCIIGPKHQKFPEIVELVHMGSAVVVHNSKDFDAAFTHFRLDANLRDEAKKLHQFIQGNLGSAEKNFNHIYSLISNP